MAPQPLVNELNEHLSRWLVRWRLLESVRWAIRGAAAGLGVALAVSLFARLWPLLSVPSLAGLSALLAAGGLGVAIALRWLWPIPRMQAARYFDRRLGLAERTSMALELAEAASDRHANTPAWLKHRQWEDAVAAARRVNLRSQLPLDLPQADWALPALLLIALVVSVLAPNPAQLILARQRAVEKAVEQQIAQIEAIRERIEEDDSLTDEPKDELLRPLTAALEQLQANPGMSPEQAVSILTAAQSELQALANPEALQEAQGLQQAGQNLSQNQDSQGPLGSFSENLAEGDLQQAASDLQNLDPSALSPEEQQALADRLEQAAAELSDTNPELAQNLQAAADALRQGDAQAAQEALAQASEELSQTAQDASPAQAAQEAAGQLAEGQGEIAQAAQPVAEGGAGQQGEGQATGDQALGQGQGQGQGAGQGEEMAQGQGAGAGRGEGTGEGQGGEASSEQIGQGNGPGDGGERGYEPIYSPYRLGGQGGPEVNLPESGNPEGEVVGEQDSDPNQAGRSVVPYNEVYSVYQQAVGEAIRSGQVPLGLRPIVRDYFSSLQP